MSIILVLAIIVIAVGGVIYFITQASNKKLLIFLEENNIEHQKHGVASVLFDEKKGEGNVVLSGDKLLFIQKNTIKREIPLNRIVEVKLPSVPPNALDIVYKAEVEESLRLLLYKRKEWKQVLDKS